MIWPLNGEDRSSVCDLCGRASVREHALPQNNWGLVGLESVVEFVDIHYASGKPDGNAVSQARGDIVRRIHQARCQSQEKPSKHVSDQQTALQTLGSRVCHNQEMWDDVGSRRRSV
jgi:hypothetical protein